MHSAAWTRFVPQIQSGGLANNDEKVLGLNFSAFFWIELLTPMRIGQINYDVKTVEVKRPEVF